MLESRPPSFSVDHHETPAFSRKQYQNGSTFRPVRFGLLRDGAAELAHSIESDLANRVRNTILALPRQQKQNFGMIPHSKTLQKSLANFEDLRNGSKPRRQRVNFGFCAFSEVGEVIGYREVTVFSEASPTKYERDHIGPRGPLSYAQGKRLVVSERFQRQGIARTLLEYGFDLVEPFASSFVIDVKAANKLIQSFLESFDFSPSHKWINPSRNFSPAFCCPR